MAADAPAGEEFGALLRQLRMRAGLTQEQLACGAGVGVRAVADLARAPQRHTYKVLLTRGMVGTVIYFTDAETREKLRELVSAASVDMPRPPSDAAV